MDENMTMIGDWTPPNPSPRTFMSSFLNEEFMSSNSLSDVLSENRNMVTLPETEKQTMSFNFKEEKTDDGLEFSSSNTLESCLIDGQKLNSRGGLAQRMARAGFNAPTINTARIRSANVASSHSEVQSPYLTIPPGLSPTTLLDSPVFLFNSMAQPSPTTGKISFGSNSTNSISISASGSVLPDRSSKDENLEDVVPGGFAFKPPLNATSSYFPSPENKGASRTDHEQSIQNTEVSLQQDNSFGRKDFFPRPSDSFTANENSVPINDQSEGEGDAKGELSSMAVSAPAEDGYNWRKYGQKQVKGSEYPRSYYKCTHPNCPVKKKVERSHEGHITEIIYKGAHNHAKPLPNRRAGVLPSHPFNEPQMDGLEHQANFDGVVESTSSVSVAAEFGGGPSTSIQTQDGSHFESPEAVDFSSTVSNDEEEEDQATVASVSLGGDGGEEDESESKRRKVEVSAVEMSAASRAVREPRVVVQTTSEVDILDDGYRWRKYGQKVVKGNPNPRSYYKCTNPGCTVRKHVERASHDLKSVITTYEGKHNHDVPAARNSSHSNSAPASAPLPPAQRRPDQPTAQDALMRFNGALPLTTYNLPGREQQQLGIGSAFSFMGQPGLANFGLAGLGHMGQVKMPMLGPIHSYMGMQGSSSEAGFVVPKGEPKEEPVSESNGMTAYHQLIGRLPLGHQM